MKLTYWLAEIERKDRAEVGDKAYALHCIQKEQYPTLNGFVISSLSLKELLKQTKEHFDPTLNISDDNPYSLQSAAQYYRAIILQSDLSPQLVSMIAENYVKCNSKYLILRPSLASQDTTRGLLTSRIADNHLEDIIVNLKEVWAELFTAKSLFYWKKKAIILEDINLAVLIQPIRSALASGTILLKEQEAQVEACRGLGHSLLYGELSPDTYNLDLKTGEILCQSRGSRNYAYRLGGKNTQYLERYSLSRENLATLTQPQIAEIVKQLQRLNRELNYQGILEWTILEDEQFYFTQANANFSSIASPTLRLKGYAASSGRVIAPVEVIIDPLTMRTLPPRTILVLAKIAPGHLPLLNTAAGIITEQGGMTSHAAIVARELGIPAVIGVDRATELLKTGDSILLDGDQGEIYRFVDATKTLPNPPPLKEKAATHRPMTISTGLMVNVSQPHSLEETDLLAIIDGIGLLRSESFFAQLWSELPASQWSQDAIQARLSEFIAHFSALLQQRPLFYRVLDSSDQAVGLLRGTYAYLQDSTLLDIQLEAVKQVQQKYNNIHLLLPFVRSVEEFTFCRDRVEKIGLRESSTLQLWIMAEVPSTLFLLPDYVKAGVEGISIGTNDLAQLLLGFDREVHPHHQDQRNTCPKALKKAIQQLVELAQQCGIPCSICGQAPIQYIDLIDSLVEWGITTISVEPDAVKKTYTAINKAEQSLILKAARKILSL